MSRGREDDEAEKRGVKTLMGLIQDITSSDEETQDEVTLPVRRGKDKRTPRKEVPAPAPASAPPAASSGFTTINQVMADKSNTPSASARPPTHPRSKTDTSAMELGYPDPEDISRLQPYVRYVLDRLLKAPDDGQKPEHPMAHLIAMAIMCAPKRRMSCPSICRWIAAKFSYYRNLKELEGEWGWKDGIQRSLMKNKAFEPTHFQDGDEITQGPCYTLLRGDEAKFFNRPALKYIDPTITGLRRKDHRPSTNFDDDDGSGNTNVGSPINTPHSPMDSPSNVGAHVTLKVSGPMPPTVSPMEPRRHPPAIIPTPSPLPPPSTTPTAQPMFGQPGPPSQAPPGINDVALIVNRLNQAPTKFYDTPTMIGLLQEILNTQRSVMAQLDTVNQRLDAQDRTLEGLLRINSRAAQSTQRLGAPSAPGPGAGAAALVVVPDAGVNGNGNGVNGVMKDGDGDTIGVQKRRRSGDDGVVESGERESKRRSYGRRGL